MTIPASDIVAVTPSVLSAGGDALEMNGLALTTSARIPTGAVLSFGGTAAVASYFGPASAEALAAPYYFLGFENSNKKPGRLLMAQYPTASVAAWLRGGNVASAYTLAALKALSGVLTLTVNGTAFTSATINLSGATSFSSAASLIQAGFTSPTFAVTFESVSGAFVFTTTKTDGTATITSATGTLAAPLLLTPATGAVTSQGAPAATPSAFMTVLTGITQNWAAFTTLFDPDSGSGNTQKLAFAAWTNGTNNRFLFAAHDTDAAPTLSNAAATSLGYLLGASGYSGTAALWQPSNLYGALALVGMIASIDFDETNGRATLAFKSQSGLTPGVTDQTVAGNLRANGYNYYGAYATASDQFNFIFPGSVSGSFKWIDSYVNQIKLNADFQQALMVLVTSAKSIPYNQDGYTQIRAACQDTINAALNFGSIRAGVTLSVSQAAQVNANAGVRISDTLSTVGYYLQIRDATAQVRGTRGSPPMTFWYTDGQSVQSIALASINVQ